MPTRSSSREEAVEQQPYQLRPWRFSAYRKLEPLKRSQVAADASLSWHIVQASIQNTVFLISSCLKIGEKVAIVLKDIGVIFIDGMTFQMKFYYDFLQKLSGKENLRKAVLKVSCRFVCGPDSPVSLAVPTHGPPRPGHLHGLCKCCGAVSSPWLRLLMSPVPQL